MTLQPIGFYGTYQNAQNPYLASITPPQIVCNPAATCNATNPSFKAAQPDVVQLSAKNQIQGEEKKNKGLKIVLGIAAAAALIAGAVYFIKKGQTSEVKQLAEHIDFKEAKTVEEAIKWGQEHLGIKSYTGFETKDLETVNWLNEGLTNISNKMKGKLCMPNNAISVGSKEIGEDCIAAMGYESIFINKDFINNIDTVLNKHLKRINGWNRPDVVRFKNGEAISLKEKIKIYDSIRNVLRGQNALKKCPLLQIEKAFNNTELKSIIEKAGIETNIEIIKSKTIEEQNILLKKILDELKKNGIEAKPIYNAKGNEFSILYHEMGHLQHQNSAGNELYEKMGKLVELEERKITDKTIIEDFLNSQAKQQTAARVSAYAQESPLEFVAETYADMINGIKIPDDVMALYKEYKGPMLG